MRRTSAVLLFLLSCLFATAAHPAEIRGTVRDAENGEPVAYADVMVVGTGLGTISDGSGAFVIAGAPEGEVVLIVSHVSYREWSRGVATGGPALEIELERKAYVTDEITVTAAGYGKSSMETSLPVNVIDRDDIRDAIAVDMTDLFLGEPGLDASTTGTGSVRPMIRGLFDERVLILVDGVRLSEQRPGGNHILSIDPAQIDRIETVRGPASVLYGSDAIGGVLNIITRKADGRTDPEWRFGIEQDCAYESTSSGWKNTTHARFGKGRLNGYVGGSYKDADNVETPEGELAHSYFTGGTAWAGANYEGQTWRGRLGYTFMQSDIGVPAPEVFLEDFFDDERHQDLKAGIESRRSPWGGMVRSVRIDAGWQRHERHRYRLRMPPGPSVEENLEIQIWLDIDTYTLEPQIVLAPDPKHTITAGIQLFHEDATSDRTMVDTAPGSSFDHPFNEIPVIPPSSRTGIGIYAQDEFRVAESFTITPGLRFDAIATRSDGALGHQVKESVEIDDQAVSGNLGLLCRASDRWSFFANAGRAFRAPTLLERFFFGPHDASMDDVGNPDLEPETSWNFDVGVKTMSGGRWRGELSLFHNTVSDFIAKVDADTAMVWQNLGDVRLYGAEFSAEFALGGGFAAFGSASYVRGEDEDTGEWLPSMPPLRARSGLRYETSWSADGSMWAELSGVWTDDQERVAPGERETEGWHRLDVRAGFTASRNLQVAVALENLTDELYYDHLSRVWQDLGVTDQPGLNTKLSVQLTL